MSAKVTKKSNYDLNRLDWINQPKEFYDMSGKPDPIDIAMIEADRNTKQ